MIEEAKLWQLTIGDAALNLDLNEIVAAFESLVG